jgi:hypothetical protein
LGCKTFLTSEEIFTSLLVQPNKNLRKAGEAGSCVALGSAVCMSAIFHSEPNKTLLKKALTGCFSEDLSHGMMAKMIDLAQWGDLVKLLFFWFSGGPSEMGNCIEKWGFCKGKPRVS